jgi:hypothetical protein
MKGDKFTVNSYEYQMLDHIPNDKELKDLGSEGWELCGILGMDRIMFYFKRKNGEFIGISNTEEVIRGKH